MQLTINYGIDLGTTNSAIAFQELDKPQLLLDAAGEAILPSVVHIASSGDILTGNPAKPFMNTDPENTKTEFKRLMGTKETLHFPQSGKAYLPEELSALILQNLLARTARFQKEPVRAAVVTIPAMFHLPQNDATRKAAQLAGIEHAILLQEPIAAAVAHASLTEKNEGIWLIYDLGGGTFDVSLVRSKGGRLQVLDHDGDNQLGGKDLDRMVVNEIAQQIREQWGVEDFQRSNPTYREAFSKMKTEAEKARILLSSQEQTPIRLERLIQEEFFEMSLDRGQLEDIIQPTIARTVKLCQKVLRNHGIKPNELNGIVMVGGPTLTPCLPVMLQREIGAEARHVMDPISIVAYGAAVYASTQKMPEHLRKASARTTAGAIDMQLAYEAMTTNPRPVLAGRFSVQNEPSPKSFRVTRADGGFDTGQMPLLAPGTFMADLLLRQNALNAFHIQLLGADGATISTSPDEFTILHGLSVGQPPLSQSVGIMLADNTVAWYIRKGAPLPAEKTLTHYTTVTLKEGQSGEAVHVPLVQGESERADRNKVIGVLHIHAEHIRHDLPIGSEVQVTLSVDAFSQTIARAYVPSLDQWFDNIIRFDMEIKKPEEMRTSFAKQTNRLSELEAMAAKLDDEPSEHPEASERDEQITQIEQLIKEGDTDSMLIADKLIREMADDLDHKEDANQASNMEEQYREQVIRIDEGLKQEMSSNELSQYQALKKEYGEAIKTGDIETAKSRVEEITHLGQQAFFKTDGAIFAVFAYLAQYCTEKDIKAAQPAILDGVRAMQNKNQSAVRDACLTLMAYLPKEERETGILSHVR